MIRKGNYKPTLPIFGEELLGVQAKSVRFEDKSDPLQQYDSLYDDHMKEYFNRPKIKKRLVQLGVTDSIGNPLTNKEQERNAMKKKQLLKEREEIVKKIRIREADRIARLASASNKVSKSCVACETHNRILSYMRNHMCPIHSNVTYQRAKETLKDAMRSHDLSSNEDNLAKLEAENKTLKNLWYSEVLRMEEEALQQQLKNEKRRLQQVLFELKKLKQQKEAIDMDSLEEIKINLYSKIKRRLGLQALLTTLREVEDGVTAAMYDKFGQDVDVDNDMDDWSLPPQLNRVGLSFQYLPPPTPQTPAVSSGNQQYVRPSSAPVGSRQFMNNSELSLHQPSFQYDEQIKKRPSSSRGYRADNRVPYSRGTISSPKQTANISPLVNSTSALPQQFSNTVKSNSSLVNGPLVNNEDVDDDSMPLDEPETALEGLSDIEMSSLPSSTSDEPVTIRDKIRHGQGEYSVMSESALINHRPPIPAQRSIPTNLSKIKQSSEKKVNFINPDPVPTSSEKKVSFIDPAPSSPASGIGSTLTKNTEEQPESTTEQFGSTTETTQHDEATSGELNLKDAQSAEIVNDVNKNNADVTEEEYNLNSLSDLRKAPYEKNDHQSIPSLPPTHTTSDDSTKTTPKKMEDIDPIVNEELFDKIVAPSRTESQPTTYAEGSTPKIMIEDMDPITEQVLMDAAAANKPNRSFMVPRKSLEKAAQVKNLKRNTSSKKLNAKSSKQLVKSTSSRKLNAKNSKQFDSKTTNSKPKQGAKQTSKKPNKMGQDWKNTILQTMKK